MLNRNGQADANDGGLTPQMIEAGGDAIIGLLAEGEMITFAEELAERAFLAMMKARAPVEAL